MADSNYGDSSHSRREAVHLEDVVEVGSRISWGAILAGAVMALAVCFVLNLLGQAVGISLADRMSSDRLGTMAAIWAMVTSILGLFVGGWVTSQCVVGETKTESIVHGIIMWGVALAFMLWGTSSGINANFTGMMKVASIAGVTTEPGTNQSFHSTSSAAVPQEHAQDLVHSRQADDRATAPNANEDRRDDQRAAAGAAATNNAAANHTDGHRANDADRAAARATWWTLANTVLSILAAIGGAFAGAGPTFRLIPLHVTHRQFSSRGAMPGGA
jgi:hypothetical protein